MGNHNLIDITVKMKAIIFAACMIAMVYCQMPVPQGVHCVNSNGMWMPTAATGRRAQGVVNYYACPYLVKSRRLQAMVPTCTMNNNRRRLQAAMKCPIKAINGFNFQCKTNRTTTHACPTTYTE